MKTGALKESGAPRRHLPRWSVTLGIIVGCALFVAANAHLIYVSFASQPECVTHLKAGHTQDGYRAARSSC